MKLAVKAACNALRYPYGALSADARLLIALRQYTNETDGRIAEIMGLANAVAVMDFWNKIKQNSEGLNVVLSGLPSMCGESLPEGFVVRCKKCKKQITWVPCVTCCSQRSAYVDRTETLDQRGMAKVRLPDPNPTREMPGTAAKIEVLAERVRLGYELWHADDATIGET
jgi:hypothetical protein